MLFLQHASDPIVWWSPDLMFSRPDWLIEPPGRDRTAAMRWYPFVTFSQVGADIFNAAGVPGDMATTTGITCSTAGWR